MSTYLILDLLVLAVPLLLSFDRKVAFFRRWPAVFGSIVSVGGVYVVWDIFAAKRGDWSFNEEFVGDITIGGLPLEEVLFFVVVPYACIFVLEVVRAYLPEKELALSRGVFAGLGAVLITLGLIFFPYAYTLTVLVVTGAFFLLAGLIGYRFVTRRSFWLALGISYLPFLVSNGILTGLPVVVYGKGHILGIRIGTIPLEDFFYSLSLLGFGYLVFLLLDRGGK